MLKTHEILPRRLYIRGRLDNRQRADKTALLQGLNLAIVVSLVTPYDPFWQGVVEYIHRPMADGKQVPDFLRRLAMRIAGAVNYEQKPTLIYCNGGRNRSALLAGLVVKTVCGLTGPQAVDFIRARRPNALANPVFEEYLRNGANAL